MRRVPLSQIRRARRQHAFQPAHPISKAGNLLAHSHQVNRDIAHTLVKKDDLAQRLGCISIEAHAVALRRRRIAGPRFAGAAKVSVTVRWLSSATRKVSGWS
jgi:hypothetical protein